ncbi:MAG TPA: hypothetical protein VH044_08050 [Polyangiaceae bacterium]|jgi:hypothetical protein|nr:hypothetical protein [Polyangiaceae bacterium]
MRNASILAALFAFGVGTFAMTRDAHALGPVDLEIGAKIGVGTSPTDKFNYNPLGFGVGARGGVDFFGVYAGVQFMYYVGGSEGGTSSVESINTKTHAWLYGIEGGYNINVSILTIRPQLGLGNSTLSTSENASGTINVTVKPGGDDSNFYLEPGVTVLATLGIWYVGADANLLWIPALDDSQAAFTLHGQVGFKF